LILYDCLFSETNQPTITACKEQLINTPLAGWINLIELNKAHYNIMDTESIQKFINELIAVYGEPDHRLAADLT
jgi:hypothetical protein